MEPALKQRLLGAAVLIALAVVFLPMFFSGAPPKPANERVSLDIPAEPESKLQSQVFDLSPEAQTKTAAPSAVAPPPAAASAPAEQAPVESTPAASQSPSPAVAESAPAPASVAAPIGTAAANRYAISLGVFAETKNADGRLAQAKLLGYPAYMETVDVGGKKAYGVRIGPYAGRASAEAARLKLGSDFKNTKPALVALDNTRTSDFPATEVAKDQPGGWAVQLAAYRDRNDAVRLQDQVRNAGFEAFIDDTRDSGGTWWRVRVGPRTQRADAEKLRDAIKTRLGKAGLVVTHP